MRIVREDFGYVLHADGIEIDLELFETKVNDGKAADRAGDTDTALAHYAEAMAHYAVRRWHDICVRRLRDELDVTPSIETSRVYTRAMTGELRQPTRRSAIAHTGTDAAPLLSEVG